MGVLCWQLTVFFPSYSKCKLYCSFVFLVTTFVLLRSLLSLPFLPLLLITITAAIAPAAAAATTLTMTTTTATALAAAQDIATLDIVPWEFLRNKFPARQTEKR